MTGVSQMEISKNTQLEISGKVLNMSMGSILDLLSKYPIVTRKLLLIRPLRPNNDGDAYINEVADAFVSEADKADWDVLDLKGNNATPSNIYNEIKNWKPDWVVYYGHSLNSNIPGQENNQLKTAISASNVSLLSNITASITACHTMTSVGIYAKNAGAIGYLGYNCSFTLPWGSLLAPDSTKATNEANIALLNGEKYVVAKEKGRNRWKKFYDDLNNYLAKHPTVQIDPTIPGGILANSTGLDYVGDPNAVARPIGILLSTQ
jgi:hypothetical protein